MAVFEEKINLDEILAQEQQKDEKENSELTFDSFATLARSTAGGVIVEGEFKGIEYKFAKCCNPIPGDPIVGFITIGEGIKIHRKDCKNLLTMAEHSSDKIITVQWPRANDSFFVAGINVRGEDSPGILNDISNSITSYKNTNIKSVNINTSDSVFYGTVTVYVSDIEHLQRLIERLRKNKGIYSVERFDSETDTN